MNAYRVDGSGRVIPSSRVPLLLLAAFLGMTMWIGLSPPAAAGDREVNVSLAILARACEIEGGHFEYEFHLREDGSLESVNTTCSGKADSMCMIWEDGAFVCVKKQPQQPIQQQIAIVVTPGSVGGQADDPQAPAPALSSASANGAP